MRPTPYNVAVAVVPQPVFPGEPLGPGEWVVVAIAAPYASPKYEVTNMNLNHELVRRWDWRGYGLERPPIDPEVVEGIGN
jgi:hypothetical protein